MEIRISLISLFLLSFSALSAKSVTEIREIKQAMIRSIESPEVTDSLYSALKSRNSSQPLIIAYIGTLEALKAKHSWNPYNKLKYVAQSQKTMQLAVNKSPEDIEIRFMRFSIQHYTPSFLGYSKDLNADRKMILKLFRNRSFGQADKALIKNIASFMIESKRCTAEELSLLKKYV